MKARTVAEVMAGEARSEEDLEMIASTIVNRSQLAGVSLESIVQAPGQFDAYNKSLPPGTTKKDVARAKAILDRVVKNGVPQQYADAIGYARDYATDNLPKSWQPTGAVTPDKHVVFRDPAGGYIATTQGYKPPRGTLSAFPEAPSSGGLLSSVVDSLRDLVRPTSVQTAPVGGLLGSPMGAGLLEKPKGMAALAPHGLIENYGPNRPNRPDGDVISLAGQAVNDVLGDDWSVVATSGTEGDLPQYGSPRHKTGKAMDFYAKNTRTGQVASHAQMAQVAQQAAALGGTGIGFGAGYMDKNGISKVHVDTARPNKPSAWGAGGTWSTMDPDERRSILGGMHLGTPAVGQFAAGDMLPDNPNKMSAPVGRVETAQLGPAAANPANAPSASLGMFSPISSAEAAAPGPFGDVPAFSSPMASGLLGGTDAGWKTPSVQRGIQLAALDPAMTGAPVSDAQPPNIAGLLSPSQQMAPFGLPSAQRMAQIASFDPVAAPRPNFVEKTPSIGSLKIDQPSPELSAMVPSVQPPSNLYSPKPHGLLSSLEDQTAQLQAQRPGFNMPAAPALSPPQTVEDAPTIAAPDETVQGQTIGQFPAAPDENPRLTKVREVLGLLTNPIGAITMGLLGDDPMGQGLLDHLNGGPAGRANADIDAGTGMQAMESGMYGPRGTFGRSASNPGAFAVSRGPNQGYDLTNQFGARTTYGPDGSIRANRDTMRAWGGLLDKIGNDLGGLLGERDKDKNRGGPVGGYSGNGLY